MELTFNKATHGYVAEFEATADFNLHIERKTGGDIRLYQRTQGGGWDIVDDFGVLKHQGVIDYDCTALVYPKYIKIYSVSEPTYAAVVSDGEVTEIKSQSKEIEVTTNGTTVVEPDSGFAYLNKVSVKTNVPQSGGSSTGGAVYKKGDVSRIMTAVSLVRAEKDGDVVITPPISLAQFQNYTPVAIGYHPADVVIMQGITMTMGEMIDMTAAQLGIELAEITKEEFYAL